MKMSKKLVSMMLAVVMLFTLTAPALAADNRKTNAIVDSGETTFYDENGTLVTLQYKDFENGDCIFYLIEDGKVTVSSYVEKETNQIIRTEYQNSIPQTTIQVVEPIQAKMISMPTAAGYIYDGRVGYNHYAKGTLMTVNYIDFSHKMTVTVDEFNLLGKYKDIAQLASFIAALCGLPGVVSSLLAKEVVAAVATISGQMLSVPDYMVNAVKTTVSWEGKTGSKTRKVEGSGYVCTGEGMENVVYGEPDYYPASSYDDHDENLANRFYPMLYSGYDRFDVVSWS